MWRQVAGVLWLGICGTTTIWAGEESPVWKLSWCLERVEAYSPKLAQARHEVQAQNERVRGAMADLGPRAAVEYTHLKFEEKQTMQMGPQTVVMGGEDSKVGSLIVAQPITGFLPLLARVGLEGVQADLKVSVGEMTKRELLFGAAEAYLKALQAQNLLVIAKASLKTQEKQLQDVRALMRVGRLTRGDELKLELAYLDAQSKVTQAVAAERTSKAALEGLMSQSVGGMFRLEDPAVPMPSGVSGSKMRDIEQALQEALAHRPEVQQARMGRDLASFGTKVAASQFAPSIQVFAKWDKHFGESTASQSTQLNKTVGIQLKWDIWNNGSTVFAMREAMEQTSKVEAMGAQVEPQLRLELVQIAAQLQAIEDVLKVAELAAEQAAESYRMEKAKFATGSASSLELIAAEALDSSAKARLATAGSELKILGLKWNKALGRAHPL